MNNLARGNNYTVKKVVNFTVVLPVFLQIAKIEVW